MFWLPSVFRKKKKYTNVLRTEVCRHFVKMDDPRAQKKVNKLKIAISHC